MAVSTSARQSDSPVDFERYLLELRQAKRPAGEGGQRGGLENLVVVASTLSTNGLARGVAVDFESEGLDLAPMLVLAFEQTGGRGRQGRSWSSPRGRGVYATLARSYATPELLPALPLLVGVGLCRALAPLLPQGCRLKWPNDLMVPAGPAATAEAAGASRGKKIGGILIEALVHPGEGCVALIGFGVNHGQGREELPAGATSLRLETGSQASLPGIGLAELTWQLVAGVERELEHVADLAYAAAAYRELSIHRLGDRLVWRAGGRQVEGVFAGFDDLGRLRLRPAGSGGELLLAAGELIESSSEATQP
jgi:BirA family transcriptional regulator, biotin operon repressor / biotin---[acetyl-CoA-carboxylase] ligase